jgi:hypothetical protein
MSITATFANMGTTTTTPEAHPAHKNVSLEHTTLGMPLEQTA